MWSSGKDATWLASNEIPEVWWDLEQRLQLSQPGFQTQGNWENKCLFFLVASFEVVFMQHRKPIGYCSVAKSCPTLATSWIAAHRAPLSSNTYCSCSDSCPLCRWCSLSHPRLSPSPPAFNLSPHLGLVQRAGSLHQVAKVLELQLQHQSFQRTFRVDFL